MIQELNKIVSYTYTFLGFEDELTNFSLSLTNPSTQAGLLRLKIGTSNTTV